MQTNFETLINSYISNEIGICENFISTGLANQLRKRLLALFSEKAFKNAGTGNETIILEDTMIRGDKIYWLDRKNNNSDENEFFDLMDAFVMYLNETCYTGITGYEFHYALYEPGSFYKRHFDRFRNNDSRQFSMITYLNESWQEGHGGELQIHHQNKEKQDISPLSGKSIFFNSSELEHEVLITTQPRMSITGWLKK
ncbi:MAG: 2OG-Fe(II) oxygenase [Saprospiraceae bacterium]|nr:2OG-Fe(II) oxygenase [Saprospiraceae bacterium]